MLILLMLMHLSLNLLNKLVDKSNRIILTSDGIYYKKQFIWWNKVHKIKNNPTNTKLQFIYGTNQQRLIPKIIP